MLISGESPLYSGDTQVKAKISFTGTINYEWMNAQNSEMCWKFVGMTSHAYVNLKYVLACSQLLKTLSAFKQSSLNLSQKHMQIFYDKCLIVWMRIKIIEGKTVNLKVLASTSISRIVLICWGLYESYALRYWYLGKTQGVNCDICLSMLQVYLCD